MTRYRVVFYTADGSPGISSRTAFDWPGLLEFVAWARRERPGYVLRVERAT